MHFSHVVLSTTNRELTRLRPSDGLDGGCDCGDLGGGSGRAALVATVLVARAVRRAVVLRAVTLRAVTLGAMALGAMALGAVTLGAMALGAVMLGAMAASMAGSMTGAVLRSRLHRGGASDNDFVHLALSLGQLELGTKDVDASVKLTVLWGGQQVLLAAVTLRAVAATVALSVTAAVLAVTTTVLAVTTTILAVTTTILAVTPLPMAAAAARLAVVRSVARRVVGARVRARVRVRVRSGVRAGSQSSSCASRDGVASDLSLQGFDLSTQRLLVRLGIDAQERAHRNCNEIGSACDSEL